MNGDATHGAGIDHDSCSGHGISRANDGGGGASDSFITMHVDRTGSNSGCVYSEGDFDG